MRRTWSLPNAFVPGHPSALPGRETAKGPGDGRPAGPLPAAARPPPTRASSPCCPVAREDAAPWWTSCAQTPHRNFCLEIMFCSAWSIHMYALFPSPSHITKMTGKSGNNNQSTSPMLLTYIMFCSGFSKIMCLYALACVFLGTKIVLTEAGGWPFWSGVSHQVRIYSWVKGR